MINIMGPEIAEMASGQYKVIIWGQDNDHVMDWLGCNYRFIVVKGQPQRGFDQPEGAKEWWESLDSQWKFDESMRAEDVNGTHMGDHRPPTIVSGREYIIAFPASGVGVAN